MKSGTIKVTLLRICFGAALSFLLAVQAFAKTPPEVISLYKKYSAALEEQDFVGAKAYAREAWEKSEELSGDSKLTGDLAFNYARQVAAGVDRLQRDAAMRAVELSHFYGDDADFIYLERGVTELTVLNGLEREVNVIRRGKHYLEFAEENDLVNMTFTGEVLTIMAGAYSAQRRFDKAEESANRALEIFDSAKDGVESAYPLHANLYSGYVLEDNGEKLAAALRYQKVMELTDGLDPEVYSLVGTTLGRWIHVRDELSSEGKLEDAEAQGFCKCWPYDKERNEDVKPIVRKPPKMPSRASQSGYVVITFDLTDEGRVTNERVITAWPDYFEKPAVQSLSKWQYSERTSEQTDADRKDLITTIKFRLVDEHGDMIW